MTTQTRDIVRIDEEKCDGCGQCIPSCAEGALAIVDGKAKIVKDMYCDGLGACLGACPQDALEIIKREAEPFDEEAAMAHVERTKRAEAASGCPCSGDDADEPAAPQRIEPAGAETPDRLGCGCPGSAMQDFSKPQKPAASAPCPCSGPDLDEDDSELTHWPVQLRLVPPHAPFLKGADLLVAADCAPVALARFHEKLLAGKKVLIGCPKFDDAPAYVEKMRQIFEQARPASVTVARMEVPCCNGLSAIVHKAARQAAADVAVKDIVITRKGAIVEPDPQQLATI